MTALESTAPSVKPPMNTYHCLIIEDEADIAAGACEYFNLFEVKTHYVHNATDALDFLENNTVQLILLDVNLGTDSGFALCKTIRQTLDIPILFVSARTSNEDMLLGLNIGADDYITKPYSLSVLLAKVKNILKRYATTSGQTSGGLSIHPQTGRILLDGQVVELKNMEHKLLKYLLQHKGRVIGKEELFTQVWGDTFVGDGTLNVHIRHLREKIEKDPKNPMLIKTVWGTGYVYEEPTL